MGLFGMMSGLLSGMQVNLVAPQTFIRRPERFLQVLADTGATITTGPNFSYELIARVARASLIWLRATTCPDGDWPSTAERCSRREPSRTSTLRSHQRVSGRR